MFSAEDIQPLVEQLEDQGYISPSDQILQYAHYPSRWPELKASLAAHGYTGPLNYHAAFLEGVGAEVIVYDPSRHSYTDAKNLLTQWAEEFRRTYE